MADFFSSEAGQCASLAKQFLESAHVLDVAQRDRGRILFRPTLALAGHGLELMLKACLLLNGQKPPTKGRKGHEILELWTDDMCEPLRGHVFINAMRVAVEHRAEQTYADVPDDDEVLPIIEEHIVALCKLHGGVRYPLRYAADTNQKAPRTPFLVNSLWGAADDLVMRPNEFELLRFRGQV